MKFLKTAGQRITDEDGREVLLTGYGIGNWMNQEGFLFGSSVFGTDFKPFMRAEGMDRGRSINQTILETCGREYADGFWKRFYRAYFAKEDIEHLAKTGMNSVRLPLRAASFLKEEPGIHFEEETFSILDGILDACEENGIYVILDMHAAAAGQSGIGCDDGVDNMPHLYTDEEGWERTILLWEEFAGRYKERGVVAGYELLNEPLALPVNDSCLPELVRFYDETIRRIRAIDRRHILFLQGHRFASRWDIFQKEMDPECHNWVLTMHMYETLPDLGAIGPILAAREELDVPVWMGETGGSSRYMTVLYEMFREHHIGVNVWCHKAVEGADAATLCTYKLPEGFDEICAYAQRGASKPSYERSRRIFDEYIENVRFDHCSLLEYRADAILRRPGAKTYIPATGYDMLPGAGISFRGNWPYCVFCGYRREDRMHLVYEQGFTPFESPAFAFAGGGRPPKYGDWPHLLLALSKDEFACYSIREIGEDAGVFLSCMSREGGTLACTIRGKTEEFTVSPGTEFLWYEGGAVPAGEDTQARIACTSGNVTLREILFQRCEKENV